MSENSQIEEVQALLERLLAESPERRPALADRLCRERPELRERIGRLLRLAEDEGFLDGAAIRPVEAEAPGRRAYAAGSEVGAYRLLHLLGRGGMAEVWLAERREGGFHQQAALKLMAHAYGSLSQRFAVEREILAGLAHPGIARMYDGGVEADGTAYMVMEFIEGEHLIAYARGKALGLSERLRLFLQICDAVAYAHTRLVVHRDLKPTNVLVTADGQAKLLDFGIAKLLDDDAYADSTRTIYLSPAYAAPEQLSGGAIGTATDVYALGMVLFEMLVGSGPWPDEPRSMAAAMRRTLDEPVPAPSRAARNDAPVPARALRGDLDAIVGKALRREPEARYPDARALADDVRRCLDHRPVRARAGARVYVARRFVRRNWLPLSMAGLLFVAMAGATAAIAWQAQKARSEARRAEAVQGLMVDLFKTNSALQNDPAQARQTADAVLEVLRRRGRNPDAIASAQQSADVPEQERESTAYLLPIYWFTLSSAQNGAWQLDAAEASIRKAVALRTQTDRESDALALDDRGLLAATLLKAGKYKDGLEVVLSVKETALRVLGPDENDHRTIILFNCGRAEIDAGDLDGAYADLRLALEGRRVFDSGGFITALVVNQWATVLNELGRQDEAVAALDEERSMRRKLGSSFPEASTRLLIRIELDGMRLEEASDLLSKYSAGGNSAPDLLVNGAQRDLLEAELELLARNFKNAAELAGDVVHRVRSSEQAPYLRALAADGEWIEGLARLRAGGAAAAKPLLDGALATVTDLYLPKSPKIAQAQLALAECALAQGHREEARTLIEQAAAIEAQHSSLSRRYTEPLQRLRAQLGTR